MGKSPLVLSLDFETASLCDLKKAGASRYSKDASTLVIVVCWRLGNGPIKSATIHEMAPRKLPVEIEQHILAGGTISGWNAHNFEANIIRNYFQIDIADDQIIDTMHLALHAGFPASLGESSEAMGLSVTKDKVGAALMMRMSRPRSNTKAGIRWWHDEDAEKLRRLVEYCIMDVATESEALAALPALGPMEAGVQRLHVLMNREGLRIDMALADKLAALVKAKVNHSNIIADLLTTGAVFSIGTETEKLRGWLGDYDPGSLDKAHVAELLAREDLPPLVRAVLELRQSVTKASVKKIDAAMACADPDGVVRGCLAYYGANRSGRTAGRLIQPQNVARGVLKKPQLAIDKIMAGANAKELEAEFEWPVMDIVASCLRGLVIPKEGRVFVIYDLSQIEARVLPWLAGQADILEVFASGQDVYTHTAKKLGSVDRQFGKVLVLACGYGMGAGKFKDTAKTYGLDLSDEEAQKAVTGWRDASPKIVEFWNSAEAAVMEALKAFEKKPKRIDVEINAHLTCTVSAARNGRTLLTLLLPSGRRLYYRDAAIEDRRFTYAGNEGGKWGRVESYSGKIVENIVQAVARDCVYAQALLIQEAAIGEMCLAVHDELVLETDIARKDEAYEKMGAIMNRIPAAWCEGLPIAAEGHIATRYGKG